MAQRWAARRVPGEPESGAVDEMSLPVSARRPHERESLCHFLKTTEPPKHKSAISAHPQPEKRSVILLSPGRKVDYVGFIEKYSSLQSGRPL